jgi:hypothetical protein
VSASECGSHFHAAASMHAARALILPLAVHGDKPCSQIRAGQTGAGKEREGGA